LDGPLGFDGALPELLPLDLLLDAPLELASPLPDEPLDLFVAAPPEPLLPPVNETQRQRV